MMGVEDDRSEEVRRAFIDSPDDSPRIVVIEGPRGAGKTAMLAGAVRAASAAGHAVMTCAGLASHAVEPTVLATRDDSGCGEGVRVGADADLRGRLAEVSARRPVLVALDDVHSAGSAAACSLARVPRELTGRPVTWLLGRRPNAGAPELDRLFLDPRGSARRIALGPWPEAKVAEVAAAMLGAPPDREILSLLRRCGTLPAFVVDTLRGLREEDRVVGQDIVRLAVPGLPRKPVERAAYYFAALAPDTRRLVQVISASDNRATLDEVADLLGQRPASLVPALEEGASVGVLDVDGEYAVVTSESWQAAIAELVPAPARQALDVRSRTVRPADTAASRPNWSELSEIELTIAELVRGGMTNQQVANRVHLSKHTVNYHLRKVFRKLQVSSRVDLARIGSRPSEGHTVVAGGPDLRGGWALDHPLDVEAQ